MTEDSRMCTNPVSCILIFVGRYQKEQKGP